MKGRGTALRQRADLGAREGDLGRGVCQPLCLLSPCAPGVLAAQAAGFALRDRDRVWMDRRGWGGGWSGRGPEAVLGWWHCPCCGCGAASSPCLPLCPCRAASVTHTGLGTRPRGPVLLREDRHFLWSPEGRSQQGWWLQLQRAGLPSGFCQAVWLGWGEGRGDESKEKGRRGEQSQATFAAECGS